MRKLLLFLFVFLLMFLASISTVDCYARIIRVELYTLSSVKVGEQTQVTADIFSGNNLREIVRNVSALLILPEGAKLASEANPVFIDYMGPGPDEVSCNWTVLFDQAGIYAITVNVSCIDTQGMPQWLMNLTTVKAYDFPHAEFAHPSSAYVNQTVVFDATESYSRTPNGNIVSYQWDFGDGTNIRTSNSVVEHAFSLVGNQTVFLNVTDSEGLFSSTVSDIRIRFLGDINSDNVVNILDISVVASSVGSRPGDEKWNAEADLNGDSVIDIIDVAIVAVRYGTVI